MPVDVDAAVRDFRRFLEASWPAVERLLPLDFYGSDALCVMGDWIQGNWELLVECRVLGPRQFLPTFFAGADFHASGRILYPDAQPTHEIWCHVPDGTVDALTGERLPVGFEGRFAALAHADSFGSIMIEPPFDHALVYQDPEGADIDRMIPLACVKLELRDTCVQAE